MNILIWNVQGAGKSGFRGAMRYLLKHNKIDILAMSEPQISGTQAQKVRDRLNFTHWEKVDAVGRSGGLWLLWNDEVTKLQIMEINKHFIHAKIWIGAGVTNLIVLYAPPTAQRRIVFWSDLEKCIRPITEPLFVGGYFNTIVSLDERQGGPPILSEDSNLFAEWIERLNLIDMGSCGSKFTWKKGVMQVSRKAKRLDRVLTNIQGRLQWEEAVVKHLPALSSDHNPLFLCFSGNGRGDKGRRPFRLEAAWIDHPQFLGFVREHWKSDKDPCAAVAILREDLLKWNKVVFGNIHIRKADLVARIEGIKKALENGVTEELIREEQDSLREFEKVSTQEEMMWFQKSRQDWLKLGDRNMAFFHASTVIRRRRNQISSLQINEGTWIVDKVELEEHAVGIFIPSLQLTCISLFIEGRTPPSEIWRGLKLVINGVIGPGTSWNLGDGRKIKFWDDPWLGERRLLDIRFCPLTEEMSRYVVRDYWIPSRGWNWDLLNTLIPPSRLLLLASTGIVDEPGIVDILAWAHSANGEYTVRSAYTMIRKDRLGRRQAEDTWLSLLSALAVQVGMNPYSMCLEIVLKHLTSGGVYWCRGIGRISLGLI
ncbi:hypothetical protein V2J09_018865 [Rumex salicifolius]